ncbi:hypothetical protein ABZ419_30855 [Streptomyces cinnamoneus]|uniref:hypothetical protein n=1 Tax=Streptomyces cinnamoneus TaxID=53446 RepID=UPI0033ED027C
MIHKTIRRVAATAGLIVAAGTLQIATSAPAQASPVFCQMYLKNQGYTVGPRIVKACIGASDDFWDDTARDMCELELKDLGVKARHASEACAEH